MPLAKVSLCLEAYMGGIQRTRGTSSHSTPFIWHNLNIKSLEGKDKYEYRLRSSDIIHKLLTVNKGFAYLPRNKASTWFCVHPHQAHEGWATGLLCSSGRDGRLIRAWSIDLEYRQIYYCGRTMRAYSSNYRTNQYWWEIIGKGPERCKQAFF